MKYSLLSILILFSSFAFGQNEKANPPVIAVKIPLNESIVLEGVSIKFLEVLEDSRCPEGVSCIWAGRAIIKVEVTADGRTNEETVIFGELRPGEKKNTTIYSSSKYSINGITLNPYPTVENSEGTSYVLLVSKRKEIAN
ncbi:hypothetical protein SAMN05216556_103135 [Aequorivita viscosa]|uniref:Uncharacterized protein n=2 Tax=Aequorivita viscosa TaxID=797419 RepID=A0A1M6C5A1_9FLAO|nr:hypothetical protein SAMN05216556_103135 [Aequorivita viscosa]SHI55981.1 hypothetical protein SAMN04487908_103135 [Aequorivita viscosa]